MASAHTRAETVADSLRGAILRGEYLCGDRLVELTLSQRLGVSQNTIRDALHILENEGWVVKHARRGAHVRAFTADEAMEVYALWAAIEGLALGWAMASFTRKDIQALGRLVRQARRLSLTGDVRAADEKLLALHALIGDRCGRPQTTALLARLRNQVHLLETLRHMRAPRSLHAQQTQILLHEKWVSLIEAGDLSAAEQVLRYFIRSDGESLAALLSAPG